MYSNLEFNQFPVLNNSVNRNLLYNHNIIRGECILKSMISIISSLILYCTVSFAGSYSGGDGSETSPYQISNTTDLIELSQTSGDWNAYFYQMNDITFDSDETQVDWDGDGNPDGSGTSGFSAIGISNTPFTGSYDGGDHTINYLYVNRGASGQGMFGFCGDGAVVENLGLLNVDITSTASIGGSNVGGLIGMTGTGNTNTSVSSCYVTGAVYGKSVVGGLVGFNYGTSIITNSYSNAEVNASDEGNYAGGLVGENRGTTITGCYATGDVTGTGRAVGSDYGKEIGGLVGRNNNGTITDCYASGVVTGDNKVGGLVGYSKGSSNEITNSYAVGAVSGVFYEGVGGFIGQLGYTSVIRNCYSRGDVTRREGTNGRFGAFCGYSDGGVVEYSYSTGSVFSSEYNAWGDGDGLTANVGFIGDGSGTFTDNFFDSDVSNQSSATGATAKTTAEMTNATTTDNIYLNAGWDFKGEIMNGTDDIWNIGNGRNDGYPYMDWKYSTDDASLPVTLTLFTAKAVKGTVVLEWETSAEIENQGFNLYKVKAEVKVENTPLNLLSRGDLVASFTDVDALKGQGSTTEITKYSFTDKSVEPGKTYVYTLADVDYEGRETRQAEVEVKAEVERAIVSDGYALNPVYPNPFNASFTLPFTLTETMQVTAVLYNLSGQRVMTVVNREFGEGTHYITTDVNDLSSGIYFIRSDFDGRSQIHKVMLVK